MQLFFLHFEFLVFRHRIWSKQSLIDFKVPKFLFLTPFDTSSRASKIPLMFKVWSIQIRDIIRLSHLETLHKTQEVALEHQRN